MIRFTLTTQLPSGKGQIRKTWRKGKLVHCPQKRFTDWRRQAAKEILTQIRITDKPLTGPLAASVTYVPGDRRTRDIPGMVDALWHLLEFAGVVVDDGQIIDLTWATWPARPRPRVEVMLDQTGCGTPSYAV